jgi:hypothetical protein
VKLSKWVDMGQEVEVEIGVDDIRAALGEAFEVVTRDPLGEEGPSRFDVIRALNMIGAFLNALTDEQIALLTDPVRRNVQTYLAKTSERFQNQLAVNEKEATR